MFDLEGIPQPMPTFSRLRPLSRRISWAGLATSGAADFVLLFAIALALRLYGLADKPLWLDEVTTQMRVNLPLHGLLVDSLQNHHVPTYFLLVSALSPGTNPWLLRLPSTLAGAFAAAIGGAVGRTLGGRPAGLISGLLLAAAPVMVQFSQDARPYALMLATLLLAVWGLVRLATDAEAAGGDWRRGLGPWAAFLLGSLGALAVSGDAAPFLLVANVAVWPIAKRCEGRIRRQFLIRWVTSQAILLLTLAPLYLAMNRAVGGHYRDSFAWLPPLDILRIWHIAADVYLLRIANLVNLHLLPASLPAIGVGLAVPLLAAAGVIALKGRPAAQTILVLAALAMPVMLFLVQPARPLWLPRYLLWSAAAALILAGIGAAWLTRRLPAIAIAASAILLAWNLAPYYHSETVPRWDLAAAAVAPALADGAWLLVDDGAVPVMLRANLPGGDSALPQQKVLYRLSDVAERLKAGEPVVAVHGPVGQGRTSTPAEFRARVSHIGVPAIEMRIGREILFVQFVPSPRAPTGALEADARSTQ